VAADSGHYRSTQVPILPFPTYLLLGSFMSGNVRLVYILSPSSVRRAWPNGLALSTH